MSALKKYYPDEPVALYYPDEPAPEYSPDLDYYDSTGYSVPQPVVKAATVEHAPEPAHLRGFGMKLLRGGLKAHEIKEARLLRRFSMRSKKHLSLTTMPGETRREQAGINEARQRQMLEEYLLTSLKVSTVSFQSKQAVSDWLCIAQALMDATQVVNRIALEEDRKKIKARAMELVTLLLESRAKPQQKSKAPLELHPLLFEYSES